MDTHPDHVEQLRRAYRLWAESRAADATPWLDLMADDVVMRSAGGGAPEMAFTDAKSGKAQAAEYFAGLAAEWECERYDTNEFICQGDRVVVLSSVAFRFRKTGKVAESPKADVYRFRGGRIVECVEYFDTAAAHAATR